MLFITSFFLSHQIELEPKDGANGYDAAVNDEKSKRKSI